MRANPTKTSATVKVRIEELQGEEVVVPRRELNRIAGARLDEIMQMVRGELKKIGKDRLLPAGVVLTGGGAKMPGIEDYAKEALQLPVTIGKPEGLSGMIEKISDPAYAAPIGLMLENMAFGPATDKANQKIGQTVEKIKKTLRNLLP